MDSFISTTLDLLSKSEDPFDYRNQFHTDIDIYYIQNANIANYIKKQNKKKQYLLNIDYLSDIDREVILDFLKTQSTDSLQNYFYIFKSIEKSILDNIDHNEKIIKSSIEVDNISLDDHKRLTEIIEDFRKTTYDFFKGENILKMKSMIVEQQDLDEKMINLLEEKELEDLQSFIVKNSVPDFKLFEEKYKEVLINDLYKIRNMFINDTNEIYEIITKNKCLLKGMANNHYAYTKFGGGCSMEEFLYNYSHAPDIYNFRGIMIFEDKSLLIEKTFNEFEPLATKKQRLDFKNDICSKYLRNKYNKNPSLCKDFIDIVKLDNEYNLKSTFELFEKYFNNIDIFKNFNINLKDIIFDSKNSIYLKNIENAEDLLTTILLDNEVNKTIKNITSQKNIGLFDEKSKLLIKDILNQKINIEKLNEYIGKKIAKFKDSESLNEAISSFLESFGDNYDGVLNKANNHNVKVISSKNNSIILEIENFEQSKYLGSASWCISTSPAHFESYVDKEAENRQFFVFDFNKPNDDSRSLVGVTISKDGDYVTAHERNDDQINYDDMELKNIIKSINKLIKNENKIVNTNKL